MKLKANEYFFVKTLQMPNEKQPSLVIKHRRIECYGHAIFAFDVVERSADHFLVNDHHIVVWREFVITAI